MDYRERQYYLINICGDIYNSKENLMKQVAPSLKISPAKHHFKNGYILDTYNVKDNFYDNSTVVCSNFTCFASVRNEHNYLFKTLLDVMTDGHSLYYKKVDKKVLGQ